MRILISFIIFVISSTVFAGPQMMMCMSNCDKRQIVQISDQTWTEVVTIFKKKIETDDDERNNIASALKHIEADIIAQFGSKFSQQDDELATTDFTNKDETYNARKAIVLLLDNGFIQRHVLRNSQKRTLWLINSESAVALQSKKTSEIYIIDPTSTPFGTEPQISLYSKWKDEKSIKHLSEEIKKLLPEFEATVSEDDEF